VDLPARSGEIANWVWRALLICLQTPFFLSGSGYAEGTLFPWTLSDFSLMDAI